ncbi:serine/threonine-protein kinase [Streptomyces sp. NPDC051546]|uniref:serine/threonine-protein kinase n=1 Tax=Streptomyces sp. NPDC051546 TaxID=3365655 RepID=UPI0037AC43BF
MGEPGFAFGEHLAEGRFRVDGLLGMGGIAQVQSGWDTRLEQRVAIKTLLPGPASDRATVERFRREAHTMATLKHNHIVTVHHAGLEPRPDGPPVPYMVMELVDGQALDQRIQSSGSLPFTEAVRISDEILNALAASHARGVVHRDIKPANVLLTAKGRAKVTDFGLARSVLSDAAALTRSGYRLGTIAYMSPEQVDGRPDVDSRSDLYAVGLLLFEMLTGRRVFPEPNQLLVGHLHKNQRPPTLAEAGLPGQPVMQAVLDRALAKRREDRYQSAHEMRVALRPRHGWQTSPESSRVPTPEPRTGPPWPVRAYRKGVAAVRASRARARTRTTARTARRPVSAPRMARWQRRRNLRIALVFATAPVAFYLSMLMSLGDNLWPVVGVACWSLGAVVLSLPVQRLWSVRLPLNKGLAWGALILNVAGLLSTLQITGVTYAHVCKPEDSSFCLWAQQSDLLR